MLIYLIAFLTCVVGGMIDARMWGDKKDDPKWMDRYTDIFWLGGWNVMMPIIWMVAGALSLYSWQLPLIMFGMSVFWDLTFFKIESNVWVRPIRLWTALPWFGKDRRYNRCMFVEKERLCIGFDTTKDMTKFNWLRVVVLVITILT